MLTVGKIMESQIAIPNWAETQPNLQPKIYTRVKNCQHNLWNWKWGWALGESCFEEQLEL